MRWPRRTAIARRGWPCGWPWITTSEDPDVTTDAHPGGGTDRRRDRRRRCVAGGDRVAAVWARRRGPSGDRPAAGGHPRRVAPAAGTAVTSCRLSVPLPRD